MLKHPMWQYELRENWTDGAVLVCWLDQQLPVGTVLTLEGIDRLWIIAKVYDTSMEKQALHRPWRVGGIIPRA